MESDKENGKNTNENYRIHKGEHTSKYRFKRGYSTLTNIELQSVKKDKYYGNIPNINYSQSAGVTNNIKYKPQVTQPSDVEMNNIQEISPSSYKQAQYNQPVYEPNKKYIKFNLRFYTEKIKNEMSAYYNQVNRGDQRYMVNYVNCCNLK